MMEEGRGGEETDPDEFEDDEFEEEEVQFDQPDRRRRHADYGTISSAHGIAQSRGHPQWAHDDSPADEQRTQQSETHQPHAPQSDTQRPLSDSAMAARQLAVAQKAFGRGRGVRALRIPPDWNRAANP
jgi:hypothetical protein